jgi:hypothetical protein
MSAIQKKNSPALSRLLRENYKLSMDLSITIMYIFFAFSNYRQMHVFLINYKIGDITMKIIDLEIKRHDLRMEKLKVR